MFFVSWLATAIVTMEEFFYYDLWAVMAAWELSHFMTGVVRVLVGFGVFGDDF